MSNITFDQFIRIVDRGLEEASKDSHLEPRERLVRDAFNLKREDFNCELEDPEVHRTCCIEKE